MDKAGVASSGDKHDWKGEDGTVTRKDGHRNPDAYKGTDSCPLILTSLAIFKLGLCFFVTGKAVTLLRVWFIDEGTRMNSSLMCAGKMAGKKHFKAAIHSGMLTKSFRMEVLLTLLILQFVQHTVTSLNISRIVYLA